MWLLRKLQIVLLYGSTGCWLLAMTLPSREIGQFLYRSVSFSEIPQFLSHTIYCTYVPNYVCSSFFLFSLVQKVILILWVVSYVGMLFNFLTLIYIGEFCKLLLHGCLDLLFFYDSSTCILSLSFWLLFFSRSNAFSVGSTIV